MTHLDDHFAAEAREHLEQLEGLLALPQRPDAEQLLRLATAVRGSAERAGSRTVASVAERLEDAARSILSGNIAWSDEVRSLAAQTVADLKLLMRALNRWGAEEERRVRTAIDRWDEHGSAAGAEEEREGEQELPMLTGSPAAGQAPGGGEPSQAVIPITSLFYDDPGPHLLGQDQDAAVVPITSLEYDPDGALRAAAALREAFDAIAHGDAVPERPLIDLVDELFGLLDLADPGRPGRTA